MAEVNLGWNNARLQAGARGATAIVNSTANRIQSSLNNIKGINVGALIGAGSAAGLVAMAIAQIKNLSGAVKDITLEYDSLKKGLETVEGTQANVTRRLSELKEVAALPGLGMEEAIRGDIRLRSVGLSANLSKRSLVEMGNALTAVGGGKADLDGVLLALTQIVSKGKVSAEEINQIAERVPQVRAVMTKMFGTADTEAIQKMNMTAEQFISTLIEGFERHVPRASAAMRNSLENISDTWKEMGVEVGEAVLPTIIEGLETVTELSSKLFAIGKIGAQAYAGELQQVSYWTKAIMEAYKENIGTMYGYNGENSGMQMLDRKKQEIEALLKAQQDEYRKRKAADIHNDPSLTSAEKFAKVWDLYGVKMPEQQFGLSISPEQVKQMEEDAKRMREIERDRMSLAERQWQIWMSHQTPLLQIEAIQKRIRDLQAEAAGRDGPMDEKERIRLQGQILDLQEQARRIRKDEDEALKRKAEQAADIARDHQKELAILDAELAIIQARAAGEQKKADAMQRTLDIARETARIMQATGLSEDEARKRAEARANAQDKIRKNEEESRSGRRKIRSYGRSQEEIRYSGSLDRLRGMQNGRLSDEWKFPGLDRFRDMLKSRLSDSWKFPGLDRLREMQGRKPTIGQAPAANGKADAPTEMPSIEQLLKQLITTTESLKEA